MDYTITTQYHEKKGCYIYVVRLSDRVEKDEFSTLSDLAKAHKGYYSSFRGVNGFVFKTEEQAEEFCEDMMAFLDTLQARSVLSSPMNITNMESKNMTLENASSYELELQKRLRTIIQAEGEAVITSPRIVNILDDLKAFSDMPAAKYILKALISDGTIERFVKFGKWDKNCNQFIYRVAENTGFKPNMLYIVFKGISHGLNWSADSDSSSESKESNQKKVSKNQSVDKAPTSLSQSDLLNILRKYKFIYKKEGKYGIMNYAGEVIHEAIYNEFEDDPSTGLILVRKGRLWGYIDSESSHFIEPQFNEANAFSEDRAVVKNLSISDKEFVIDSNGNMVIPPIYDSIYCFYDGLIKVVINDLQGFIDINGEVKVPIEYPLCEFPIGSKGEIFILTGYGTKIIDKENNTIAYFSDTYYTDFDSYLGDGIYIVYQAFDDGKIKYGVISNTNKVVIPCRYDDLKNLNRFCYHHTSDIFLGARLGNKYGIISKEGKLLISFQFDEVNSVTPQDYFIVKNKNKWGIVDIHGKTIIPFMYNEIRCSMENEFLVKIGTKEGRINAANEWLPDSDSVFPFSSDYELIDDILDENGNKIYICHKGRFTYVFNEQGKELLKFQCPTITQLII